VHRVDLLTDEPARSLAHDNRGLAGGHQDGELGEPAEQQRHTRCNDTSTVVLEGFGLAFRHQKTLDTKYSKP
jgi:hypothetical protein